MRFTSQCIGIGKNVPVIAYQIHIKDLFRQGGLRSVLTVTLRNNHTPHDGGPTIRAGHFMAKHKKSMHI